MTFNEWNQICSITKLVVSGLRSGSGDVKIEPGMNVTATGVSNGYWLYIENPYYEKFFRTLNEMESEVITRIHNIRLVTGPQNTAEQTYRKECIDHAFGDIEKGGLN